MRRNDARGQVRGSLALMAAKDGLFSENLLIGKGEPQVRVCKEHAKLHM